MGKRRNGPGNNRISFVTSARTPRTTRKYLFGPNANNQREVWAEEDEVTRARDTGGSVKTYHDAQKKLPFREVKVENLRTAY